MAIAAVLAANAYNGLNTRAWNWWVFGGVIAGPVIIIIYTAVYASFAPSLLWTYVYGYNTFWWPSPYYWLSTAASIVLSLAPRYLYRFYTENYYQTDIDILTWTAKTDPKQSVSCLSLCVSRGSLSTDAPSYSDWIHDPYMPQPVGQFGKDDSSDEGSLAPVFHTVTRESTRPGGRDSFQLGRVTTTQSVTHDMSTGAARTGPGRGYGFDQADNMIPAPIRRYTSRSSFFSSVTKTSRTNWCLRL